MEETYDQIAFGPREAAAHVIRIGKKVAVEPNGIVNRWDCEAGNRFRSLGGRVLCQGEGEGGEHAGEDGNGDGDMHCG
jgi:hypothetical protein